MLAIPVASFTLTRYFVSGGQDVVSAHVYTCAIKRKLLLACGQTGMRAEVTHRHIGQFCLTKASHSQLLQPQEPSSKKDTGCVGCAEAATGVQLWFSDAWGPGTHAEVAVKTELAGQTKHLLHYI